MASPVSVLAASQNRTLLAMEPQTLEEAKRKLRESREDLRFLLFICVVLLCTLVAVLYSEHDLVAAHVTLRNMASTVDLLVAQLSPVAKAGHRAPEVRDAEKCLLAFRDSLERLVAVY